MDTPNPVISFVSLDSPAPNTPSFKISEDSQQASLELDGWQLQPRGGEVIVKHALHLVPRQASKIPSFVPKVFAAEAAVDLTRLKAIVEQPGVGQSYVLSGLALMDHRLTDTTNLRAHWMWFKIHQIAKSEGRRYFCF